ncbi:MAG: hypothetical protein DRH89_05635 [Candidatus Cloacimonadota bacterium]|nr:MAG: hypothetical protein DRH89_05635 [Candidatus Cloacimonadota bacterium]
MKKILLVLIMLLLTISMFAVWQVGEPITDDYSWTDNNGEYHSIHELTTSGKAILIFWGEDW